VARRAPGQLSAELSELLYEVRDVTSRARRTALEIAQSGGASYEEALGQLYEAWMRSASCRRQIVSFASAAEMGVPLWHHHERCEALACQAGLPSLRALFWAASRRMNGAKRGWPRIDTAGDQAPGKTGLPCR